jgi:hypothetical protein
MVMMLEIKNSNCTCLTGSEVVAIEKMEKRCG